MKHILASLMLVMLAATLGQARDIFVSVGGVDDPSTTGTISDPFASPEYVIEEIAVSYDNVIVRSGETQWEYDTWDLTFRGMTNVTLKGWYLDATRPWIKGHMNYDYDTIDPGSGETTPLAPFATIILHADSSYITLDGLKITGGSRYNVSVGSNWIYDWDTTEISHHAVVNNCVLSEAGRDAIKVNSGADYFTASNNEIFNTCAAARGAPTEQQVKDTNTNGEAIDIVNSDESLVEGNYVHDIPFKNAGIVMKGGSINPIIRNNIIKDGMTAIYIGGNTGQNFMDCVVNPDWYQIIGGLVYNNVAINMLYPPFPIISALDTKVFNNTGVMVGTMDTATAAEMNLTLPDENQVVAGSGFGAHFRFLGNYRNVTCGDSTVYEPWSVASVNLTWANNIIYHDSGPDFMDFEHSGATIMLDDQGTLTNPNNLNPIATGELKAGYNVYFDPNWPTDLYWSDQSKIWDEETGEWLGYLAPGYPYRKTLAEWKSLPFVHHPDWEAVNSIYVEPEVDLVTGYPDPTSPVLGVGLYFPERTTDINGNPIDPANVDVGAYQLSSVTQDCDHLPSLCLTQETCEAAAGGWTWWPIAEKCSVGEEPTDPVDPPVDPIGKGSIGTGGMSMNTGGMTIIQN